MPRFPWTRRFTSTGQLWPVLALLLAAVVLPTAGLLWFMSEALRNEEAAFQFRLGEVYEAQLRSAERILSQHWRLQQESFDRAAPAARLPSERFAALVGATGADGAVVFDEDRLAYPELPAAVPSLPAISAGPGWPEARRAEFEQEDPSRAARLYRTIAETTTDGHESARAWQASARCLLKVGDTPRALSILTEVLASPRYREARDEHGRSVAASALVLALGARGLAPARAQTIADRLEDRLADYGPPLLRSGQRRFLRTQLRAAVPSRPVPAIAEAEELSAAIVSGGRFPSADGFWPSAVPGVWGLRSADGGAAVFFREATLIRHVEEQLARESGDGDAAWTLLPPGSTVPQGLRSRRLAEPLRDWQIALRHPGADPPAATRSRRVLWVAALIPAVVGLTLLAGRRVTRQLRTTRLKDDLLATVSHELKTPLSSMRVLVDTLLEGAVADPIQQREYLALIAQENKRLSGLIDDFLTFSRLEHGRYAFEFSRVSMADVIERACTALGERLRSPGCRFETVVEPDLPPVQADRDALVTVLLNLLDNALKYTGPEKHVILRARRQRGEIHLEVEDDGVGFSRRVGRRVFERFFQADRRALGSAAGVGLGLSIVKSIVAAHHGHIDVVSQPGKGSRFTVGLKVAEPEGTS